MLEKCRMNRYVIFLIVISLLLTGCGTEDGQNVSVSGENMSVSGERVSNGGDLSENEETVGDAVPVRELTGLDGTEDGIIIVTREEFYSGAYLE